MNKQIISLVFTAIVFAIQGFAQEAAKDSTNIVQDIPATEVSFQLALIPGGSYTMGSPAGEESREEDEGPQHLMIALIGMQMLLLDLAPLMKTQPLGWGKTDSLR